MSQWSAVVPVLLCACGLLALPGLAAGYLLGLRRTWLVGAAPLLSCTAASVGIRLSTLTHQRWGPLPLLLATALLGLGCVVMRLLLRRLSRPAEGTAPWYGRAAATAAAGLVIAAVAARGMRSPLAVQQSWDDAFHLNAIAAIHETGRAGAKAIGSVNTFGGPPGPAYPPTFEALASLLLDAGARDPGVAANVLALAVAALAWPLGLALLLRVTVGRSLAGWVVALAVSTAAGCFPWLLLAFGVVWPVALGVAVTPAALAVLWVLGDELTAAARRPTPEPPAARRPARAARAATPSGASTRPRPGAVRTIALTVVLLALAAPGLYDAHPGSVLMLGALAVPLVLRTAWAWAARWARCGRVVPAAVLALGVPALVVAAVPVSGRLTAIRDLRKMDWPAVEPVPHAVREVLTLAPSSVATPVAPQSYATAGAGLLVLVGALSVLLRRRPGGWVVACHGVVGALYVIAAAVDGPLSQTLTGYWYNDRYRIGAVLAVTAAPLAGWGAVELTDLARRATRRSPAHPWAPVAVTVLCLLVIPLPWSWRNAARLVAIGYDGMPGRVLADPAEAALYRSLPPGRYEDSIVADPWTGVVAGPLSGHRAVYPHLRMRLDPDRVLVKDRFKDYQRDPAVCAAVQRLGIRYAAEDTSSTFDEPQAHRTRAEFAGVRDLAGTPGLRRIAGDGRTTVYEVTPCQS